MKQVFNDLQQPDKLKHFVTGTLIYAFFNIFFEPYIAVIAVFAIGAGKEIYDEFWNENSTIGGEPLDYFMTILPAIVLFIAQL